MKEEEYRFKLSSKRGKYTCPDCGYKGKFSRYYDTEGDYTFPDYVGRCDRENSCAYHYPPKQFFKDNPEECNVAFGMYLECKNMYSADNHCNSDKELQELEKFYTDYEFLYDEIRQRVSFDCFDKKFMTATMKKYEINSFIKALHLIFNDKQIKNIINRYNLGTTKNGGVVFWQIDTSEKVRYGKVMYFKDDLHRDKSKQPIGVHYLIGRRDIKYRQCFFGEHLLKLSENKDKEIAIVESEKTACICSEVYTDYVWLATGGSNGIKWRNKNVWDAVQGRKVILCPDVDKHKDWSEKAKLFQSFGINVLVYEELAKKYPGTQNDIADIVIEELKQKNQNVSVDNCK